MTVQCPVRLLLASEGTSITLHHEMALVAGTKIIKPAGEKLDKLEETVSQVWRGGRYTSLLSVGWLPFVIVAVCGVGPGMLTCLMLF